VGIKIFLEGFIGKKRRMIQITNLYPAVATSIVENTSLPLLIIFKPHGGSLRMGLRSVYLPDMLLKD
jgi:hypothetical protein